MNSNLTNRTPFNEQLIHPDFNFLTFLYENNWPIIFYVYQKRCTFVSELEPVLHEYLKTTPLYLLAFDYDDVHWKALVSHYGDKLKFQGTPAFYFWQKGAFSANITGISKLKTVSDFEATFARYVHLYNITIAGDDYSTPPNTKSVTLTINTNDSEVVRYFATKVLTLLTPKTAFTLRFSAEDASTFTFSLTNEVINYTAENERVITTRIKNYYSL